MLYNIANALSRRLTCICRNAGKGYNYTTLLLWWNRSQLHWSRV